VDDRHDAGPLFLILIICSSCLLWWLCIMWQKGQRINAVTRQCPKIKR